MVTLKEYAEKKSISYEAVRKQVSRYREELGNHIKKEGRTQYLDDWAEEFLDDRRASNVVVMYEHAKDERIEELEQQNQNLRLKVMELQEKIIARDEKLFEMQEQLNLLTAKAEPEPVSETNEEVENPEKEIPETNDRDIQPDVQPLGEVILQETNEPDPEDKEREKPKKRWWEFWKI